MTGTSGPGRPFRLVGSGWVAGHVPPRRAASPIERQHALIEELRTHPPRYVAGAELAARTGTTVRTVERDIARLVAAGLPVKVKRGPGGGYRVDTRRQVPPLVLTPGEASAIVASLVAVGPYISVTARSALAKLLDGLVQGGR